MGVNYKEMNNVIEETIVKYMTYVPKEVSAKLGGAIPMSIEKSSLTAAKMKEKDTQMANISLEISIGIDTMQFGTTSVTVNIIEDQKREEESKKKQRVEDEKK